MSDNLEDWSNLYNTDDLHPKHYQTQNDWSKVYLTDEETIVASRVEERQWVAENKEVIDLALKEFLEKISWPQRNKFQRELKRKGSNYSIDEHWAEMPGWIWQRDVIHQKGCFLTFQVLREMDEAKDLMAVCIAILNRVYEVYVDDNETDTENLKLRSDDAKLNEAAGNDKHLLKGAITLLDFLSPNPFHSVYPLENDSSGWEAHLNSYFIEKLEGITIIDDYLKVQDEVREKSFPNQQNNGTQVESTKQVKVFIAMPFKEDWSNDVKNAIYKVADQINQDYGERIICKRADEIVEGGSITSQIEEEIKNCDYMIADVTRYNGNVMWELGYYCREQSKPIILNQNIDGSPFDVRHYRQIEYSVDALENLRDDLRKYMKKMLKLDQ